MEGAPVRSSTRAYLWATAAVLLLVSSFYLLGHQPLVGTIIGLTLFLIAAIAAGAALFVDRTGRVA